MGEVLRLPHRCLTFKRARGAEVVVERFADGVHLIAIAETRSEFRVRRVEWSELSYRGDAEPSS